MPGRFDAAPDPTEQTLKRLHEAIERESHHEPIDPETGRRPRERRRQELPLVVAAGAVMIVAFILLLVWLS